ncbi:serine hydrolase domain-containing protein [Alteribacillus sp. HJP-4]|uniref:serine hydrolase domain-containing protein n=1 Tax=Alteribacillus sp. HJP-4 TaxID=2775394 RepID=UPI0035CD33D8
MTKVSVFVGVLLMLLLIVPFSVLADTKDTNQKIQTYVEEAIEKYNIPGASLAITENGETVYQDNWGVLSDGTSVTAETPFLIGSLSKPITSLAAMMLVEDGKIKLDEPIQTYIPSFHYETDSQVPITVKHLLEQTSGISEFEGFQVTDVNKTRDWGISQAVTELSGVTLSSEPGENYEYNSANYLLIGAIVEEAADQPFSEFVQSNIFLPLGMDHSAAEYDRAVDTGYLPGFESWLGSPVKSKGLYDLAGAPYGYMSSSSNDLVEFLRFMMHGGELLTDKSLELIKTPPEEGRKYGLGWFFSETDHYLYHGGAVSDFRAEMFFMPERDYGAVLLTNKYNALEDEQVYHMMNGIRSIINGEEPEDLPPKNLTLQWTLLGVNIFIAALSVFYLLRLKRHKHSSHKVSFSIGILSILAAVGLIPLFVYSMGTPWEAVQIWTPDIAFLMQSLIVIFAATGVLSLFITFMKKKTA